MERTFNVNHTNKFNLVFFGDYIPEAFAGPATVAHSLSKNRKDR